MTSWVLYAAPRMDGRQPIVQRVVLLAGLGAVAVLLAMVPLRWALAGVTVPILIAVTLLDPAIGLIILALTIPLGRLFALPFAGAGTADALAALALAAWLVRGLASRELRLTATPLLWPLGVFLWFSALSLTRAVSWSEGVTEWLKWFELAAIYVVAVQVLRRRHVYWLLGALFAAAAYQVYLGSQQFLGQAGPDAFNLLGRYSRAYGTLLQPNPYAGYLGYLLPVALSLTIGTIAGWRRSGKVPLLLLSLGCGVLTLLLWAGIGMSFSRGAWIAAAIAVLVVVASQSRRALLAVTAGTLVLCAAVLLIGPDRLPEPVAERAAAFNNYVTIPDPAKTEITDENFSVLERLAHWQAGARMFAASPWVGLGIGNYGAAYSEFASPPWYEPLGHAHNIYVNFLAETGVFGTLAFLVLWAGIAILAIRSARTTDPLLRALAIGLLGTVVYLTVHNLFDNVFVQHLQLQLALICGSVVALRNEPTPSTV